MHSFHRGAAHLKLACALALCSLASPSFADQAESPSAETPDMPLSEPAVVSATPGAGANAMNPAISLDGLFSFSQFNRQDPLVFEGGHDPKLNGFNIQQLELSFNSNIDPYFRADANLVLTQEGIEIEEAYATTLALPLDLQLKGGQFYTAFGRNNPLHPHSWDYANKPLVLGRFFGGDGLRNPGAQISWLSPLPWYSEILVSAQNSTGETVPSFRPAAEDGSQPLPMRSLLDTVAMARWNNFFGLSDSLSLNLGVSALNGPNNTGDNQRTRIYGGDLFFKFRDPDKLSFFSVTVEFLKRYYDNLDADTGEDWGWYTSLDYRFDAPLARWHIGVRLDQVSARAVGTPSTSIDIPSEEGTDFDSGRRWRISPVVTFYPSEFSKVRLQYDYDKPDTFESAQQVVTLQLEFLMGAHGAHKF